MELLEFVEDVGVMEVYMKSMEIFKKLTGKKYLCTGVLMVLRYMERDPYFICFKSKFL